MARAKGIPDNVRKKILYRVSDMFFNGKKKVSEIVQEINADFGLDYKREAVYPLLAQARDQGLVRLVPPLEEELPRALHARFQHPPQTMQVVGLDGQLGAETVTAQAAELVLDKIQELLKSGHTQVGLGIGPGRATLGFCRYLGERLRTRGELPPRCLRLHAITAGGPTRHPEHAPGSFFNLFPTLVVADCVGLFAETLVSPGDFKKIIGRASLKEAFDQKDNIDVIVTSRGDIREEHDSFRIAISNELGPKGIAQLIRDGCVGNVQYRPYTPKGPLQEKADRLRAVTLFELDEFVDRARTRGKYVVLIARSCSICNTPQVEALRPLFEVPALKVWSHVIMDAAVATGLLADRRADS